MESGRPNVKTFSNESEKDSETFAKQDINPEATNLPNKNHNQKSQKIPEITVCGTSGAESGMFIQARIYGKPISLLIDSGAEVTILSSNFMQNFSHEQRPGLEPVSLKLVSATGDTIPFQGRCEIPIQLGENLLKHKVLIADIKYDGILGLDFMTTFSCDILVKKMSLRVRGEHLPLVRFNTSNLDIQCKVVVSEDTVLLPNTESLIAGRVIGPIPASDMALIDPNLDFMAKHEVLVAKVLINPTMLDIPLRILNPSKDPLTLHKDCHIADLEPVIMHSNSGHHVSSLTTENLPSHLPEHLRKLLEESCNNLDENQKDKLTHLLLKYHHCFSSSSQDLGMTDLTEHTIDTGNSRPIKQPPRRIPLAKMSEVDKEMQDMVEKGVIEQSDSPWSSPVVLVRKKDNSLKILY